MEATLKKYAISHKVTDIPTSFKDSKKVTVPHQSMSIQEILRRFVRRESLPVAKEGVYETRFGDLEKIQNLDITEKMEQIEDLKQYQIKGAAELKKKEEEKKAAQQAAQQQQTTSLPNTAP